MKHLSQFITTGAKYPFETPESGDTPARRWLMRQPLPDEAADGDSAYRIAYSRVMRDRRLKDLAGPYRDEAEKEARIRASAAEAIYMLPLLLEDPETGAPAFDVSSEQSMAEFEALDPAVVVEMARVYWETVKLAIDSAKKKSTTAFSSGSGSPRRSERGPSRAESSRRPGRRS